MGDKRRAPGVLIDDLRDGLEKMGQLVQQALDEHKWLEAENARLRGTATGNRAEIELLQEQLTNTLYEMAALKAQCDTAHAKLDCLEVPRRNRGGSLLTITGRLELLRDADELEATRRAMDEAQGHPGGDTCHW